MKKRSDGEIRRLLLQEAQNQGRIQFTRMSKTMIEKVRRRENEAVRKLEREIEEAPPRIIKVEVQTHPSIGVTLKA